MPEAAPAPRSFSERTRVGWHTALYAAVVLVAVLVGADGSLSGWARTLGIGCSGVLVGAYAAAGNRALDGESLRLALAYLAPAWSAFFVLVTVSDWASLLGLVLFPQVWAMLPRTGQATTATVLGGVVFAAATLVGSGSARDAVTAGLWATVLSLALGLWVTGLTRESAARAALIAELERSRADLAAAERERAALAERQRLAADIHDTLAQGFASVLALARLAEAELEAEPASARGRLRLIGRTAQENLDEARRLVAALVPRALDGGLVKAVERLAERFRDDSGTPASVEVTGQAGALRPEAEIVLLRAAQEALANVRRHAAADTVHVMLHYDDAGAQLVVRDDGRGFTPDVTTGYGLLGMRARAGDVGGSVDVESRVGGGTVVRVRVPSR